jgi:hypothetical protein
MTGRNNVDEDAVLLINANEILARDGIHGKIAPIGVGFGTGRHTGARKQPKERRQSPLEACICDR